MLHAGFGSEVYKRVCAFCEELFSQGNRSPQLLAYLVDLCEEAIIHKVQDEKLNTERALSVSLMELWRMLLNPLRLIQFC